MGKDIISRLARNDLLDIRDYIRDELCNPDAAERILQQLRKAIEGLQDMPERGKPLNAVLSVHTDFRYLSCENYRIFYLFDGEQAEVVRILHTLQDYMQALFLS